jgi:hypothetical protein
MTLECDLIEYYIQQDIIKPLNAAYEYVYLLFSTTKRNRPKRFF